MRILTYSLALLVMVGLVGCQDLSVDNPNNPDRNLALAAPADVEALVASTFTEWWAATQWCDGSMMLGTMADEWACSWANWGMRDMSSQPRVEWNNSPSYSRRASAESPWFDSYTGISNAIDGILAIRAAENVTPNPFDLEDVDTARLEAFARFTMGLMHGRLALQFDQAFIVDENIDLEAVALGQAELELRPYNEVMEAAIGFLDQAIAIAEANEFTIAATDDWIFGLDVTNDDLAALANSYAARFRAAVARTPEERGAVNWNEVMTRIDAGITEDFAPIGDDDGSFEWDCMKFYGQEASTWARADYLTIGPADESECTPGDDTINCFQEWIDAPLADRLVFDIETADRRIVGSADDVTVSGKDFEYIGTNGPFPADRGTYHWSSHAPAMHRTYLNAQANGPMPVMKMAEMDMLMAEALLRTGGSTETVAELINRTRVERGELNPAAGSDPVGSHVDSQSHLDSASLWAKLKHEKRLETYQTQAGLSFWDDRGWGDLIDDTPYHMPVPGAELETLGLAIYTFGGNSGPASASGEGTYWKNTNVQLRSAADQRRAKPF